MDMAIKMIESLCDSLINKPTVLEKYAEISKIYVDKLEEQGFLRAEAIQIAAKFNLGK